MDNVYAKFGMRGLIAEFSMNYACMKVLRKYMTWFFERRKILPAPMHDTGTNATTIKVINKGGLLWTICAKLKCVWRKGVPFVFILKCVWITCSFHKKFLKSFSKCHAVVNYVSQCLERTRRYAMFIFNSSEGHLKCNVSLNFDVTGLSRSVTKKIISPCFYGIYMRETTFARRRRWTIGGALFLFGESRGQVMVNV